MAEDNPINQEVALTILKKHGIRADAVANGREALQALENVPYDLVLMDVQMPEMDGLEATRRIRDRSSRALNSGIPVIAMTANAMKADAERCREAGMDDFLPKPVQPMQLLARIEHWIAAVRSVDAACRPAASAVLAQPVAAAEAAEADPSAPPLRFDLLCRRLLDDREIALELLGNAVAESRRNLGELSQAVARGDAEQVRQLAHKLKGVAGNMSAEPLRWACSRLETVAAARQSESLPQRFNQVEEALGRFQTAAQSLLAPQSPSGDAENGLSPQPA